MMIQPIGYFKVWRELFSKPIWVNSTPVQKTILITLIAMANFREKKWEWKGKQYTCQPGQFVTSLESIVKECGQGVTSRNVRTAIERFEKLEFLTNESTNTGRLITIVNWADYQGDECVADKQADRQLTSDRQATDKQLTTREESKEGNKVKKVIKTYSDNPYLNEAWESFVEMRKKIKAPLTDRAVTLATNKLDILASTDEEKIAILNQSTMNCWKGLFELKDKKQKGGGHNSQFEANNDWKPTDLFE